jgi:hypothetical protein
MDAVVIVGWYSVLARAWRSRRRPNSASISALISRISRYACGNVMVACDCLQHVCSAYWAPFQSGHLGKDVNTLRHGPRRAEACE